MLLHALLQLSLRLGLQLGRRLRTGRLRRAGRNPHDLELRPSLFDLRVLTTGLHYAVAVVTGRNLQFSFCNFQSSIALY